MSTRLDRIKALAKKQPVQGENREAIENLRKAVLEIAEELKDLKGKQASRVAPGVKRRTYQVKQLHTPKER